MIDENHIEVSKTARYFTMGSLNENTRQIWIVIHGFRQSAKSFLKEFEPLANDTNFFIAPEALNRFYLTRQSREVGASWMTREDRLNEIKDYINYLEKLYTSLSLDKYNAQIIILGFSQGASTATRWIDASKNKINLAVVYAGEVAPELLPLKENSGLKKTKNYYVCGTKDEFFTPEALSAVKSAYRELNFTEIFFEGKHEINVEALKKIKTD